MDLSLRAMVGGLEVEVLGFHSHWDNWEGPWCQVQPLWVHFSSKHGRHTGDVSGSWPIMVKTEQVWFQEVSEESDFDNWVKHDRIEYWWMQ